MIRKLRKLAIDTKIKEHPNVPLFAIPETIYSDKSANGLEKCIVAWINLHGGFARRVKNTGRYVDESKIVEDIMGNKRKIGTGKYIPGTGTPGTADVSSSIPVIINGQKVGLAVEWEIKIGKDHQSPKQKEYEQNIKETGGYYFVVKTFDDFYEKYITLINKFSSK